MRTASVVLIASLAMVLAGCGSTIKPDGAAASVVDLVSKQTGFKPNDVKCPSGVDAEVGKEFECHFTGPEDKDYTAHMKITKIEGDDVQFYIKTEPTK
jgi:NAD(P)H-hydrate repair Nnr-like enzyme with NAD(P)H-hydrate epimerase domain